MPVVVPLMSALWRVTFKDMPTDDRPVPRRSSSVPKPPSGLEPETCGLQNRCDGSANPAAEITCDRTENGCARQSALPAQIHPDLALVIDAWDGLPAAIRAGILAMVRAAAGTKGKGAH